MDKPMCKLCGRRETRRLSRHGFFQEVVMYKLGFVPWECVFCRKPFFRRRRESSGKGEPRSTAA